MNVSSGFAGNLGNLRMYQGFYILELAIVDNIKEFASWNLKLLTISRNFLGPAKGGGTTLEAKKVQNLASWGNSSHEF